MTGSPRVSSDALRAALQKRLNETTLRELADEIGLRSFSALARFIRGETAFPHRTTRDLLWRWYYRRADAVSKIPKRDLDTAISVLRTWVREGRRSRTVNERRLRELVEEIRDEAE